MPDDVLSGTDKLHPRWTTYFPRDYGSIGNNNGHSKIRTPAGLIGVRFF